MGHVNNAIKNIFGKMGVSISRKRNAPPDLMTFLDSRKVSVVLDVGANVGQFAQHLRARGYKGKIFSFEPIKDVYHQLEAAAAHDPDWTTFNFALGSREQNTEIHVSEDDVRIAN